jgi:hypothetical protein
MNSIFAAAAIAIQLTIPSVRHETAPKPTCNIKTVSYKFVGAPGTEFRYEGKTYAVPAGGSIELIAGKKTTEAEFAGNRVMLDLFPLDDFGSRTIPLTASAAPATANTKGE